MNRPPLTPPWKGGEYKNNHPPRRGSARIYFLFACLFFLQSATSVSAAFLNNASCTLDRLQVSIATNHTARFQTPTGVDAPTDNIVFTYSSGYSLAGIALGDIDFFHGATTGLETEETLGAAPAAGVWGVSIGASTIIFTAPTDAGAGEIAANHYVVIRIGTHAAGGAGQIVNPATPQNTTIAINGTFGDYETMGVPIISSDQVAITAIVAPTTTPSEPPPSGGGGGGGVGDIFPPEITNVQAINITSSTAEIIWTTNESSNSSVEYGLTTAYSDGMVADVSYVKSHSIKLTGLKQKTVYHFRVSSRDTANNLAVSGDFTFTTIGDVTAPIISNLQVINITDISALVMWNTDEPADSGVQHGQTEVYGSSGYSSVLTTAHAMLLSGLKPNTSYHFFVTSIDSSNNAAASKDSTFITLPDKTAPSNVLNFTATGGDAVVHLNWLPPSDSDLLGVRIVRRADGFPAGPIDGAVIYEGMLNSFDDTQVINGITYYYAAFAYDTSKNFSSGALVLATPQGPPVIPPKVPAENTTPLCSNGIDDDSDGKIDCQDGGCSVLEICIAPAPPLIPPLEIPPQPIPTPSGEIISLSPHFYTPDKTVEYIPDATGRIGVLPNSEIYIYLPLAELGVEIVRSYVVGSLFALTPTPDGTAAEGIITMPAKGEYAISVVTEIKGGGIGVANYIFVVQKYGQVVEENIFGKTDVAIPGASVLLFVEQNGWNVWNGSAFGQQNPVLTDNQGEYVFVVPNGKYYATAEKDGYVRIVTNPVDIVNNIFNLDIGLIKKPAPVPLPTEAIAAPPKIGAFADTVKNLLEQAVFGITVARVAVQQPGLQNLIENYFSPALLAISLINLASALPLFNFITYLQYLFTQPILLIRRRKRKQWGVVFNSLTKQPVDLAIVRLLQAETHLVVQTMVTDKQGRFSFLVKQGNYILEAVKPGYLFPTQYLQGKTTDADFTDLYHAAPITTQDGQVIACNIPLDPVTRVETPRQILWRKTFRSIQQDLAFITILAALTSLIIKPSAQVALLTLAQVGTYLLFKRLSAPIKAKEWGIVYDEKTREPLDQVIVRIFDKKFNKLLETKVTDKNGKYGFFVRRNVYYVTAEKEGYAKYMSPDIDLTDKDEAVLNQPLVMKKI